MSTPLWTSTEASAATRGRVASTWSVNGVSIDTRTLKPGDLFVALAGENRDGHEFVADALAKGASAALVSRRPANVANDNQLLVVADTLQALEALGRASRARTKARIGAVTGSVGKTSTKEALRHLLGVQGSVHASEASYNNHWGVPLTLARMKADTAFGVFEIGMNHPGEIEPLSRQVRPHAAIVTTVEAVHLEAFKSVEGIADAKAEIFAGVEAGGTAVLNHDNPHFARLKGHAERRGLRIAGFGTAADADARLVEARLNPTDSKVTASLFGKPLSYTVGAPGRHWVMNSLGILLMVEALGADVAEAAQDFASVTPPKGRGSQTTIRTESGDFQLIDESYNANPASMAAAIALLGQSKPKQGRRIAVLGDMLELGPTTEQLHASLAEPLNAARVDRVFCCGPLMAQLWAALPPGIRGAYAANSADLATVVAEDVTAGDVVMVKGSFGSRMNTVVEALKARAMPVQTA